MSCYGFVYVLENRCMPGIVKIGMTLRAPSARAEELSKVTGVPEPFTVIYYAEVEDPAKIEAMLHERFSADRVSNGREFFSTSPADIAEALYEHANSYWMDSVVSIALRDKSRNEHYEFQDGVTLQ